MPSIIRQGTVYGVPAKLGGLTDVTLSTPTAGQSLVYSNGQWVNQVAGGVFYGVCTTEPTVSGNERIWTVTLNNGDGFALTEGATVYIRFTHEETGSVYPTIPCLNVNGTGAQPLYMNYTSDHTGYVPGWREGQVCVFTYDGNYKWMHINSIQSAHLTSYSNSSSGLTATNVQSAIDELSTLIDNNMYYHVGDRITIRYCYFAGQLTSSQKSIRFFIPTLKSFGSDVSDVEVGAFTSFGIYQGTSNANISNSSTTGTWSFTLRKDMGIYCTYNLTTATTVSNGEITVNFPNGDSTLTFT